MRIQAMIIISTTCDVMIEMCYVDSIDRLVEALRLAARPIVTEFTDGGRKARYGSRKSGVSPTS